METVEQIQKQINALEAKKYAIEKSIRDKNEIKLIEEVMNLIDGIGITEGDYYACTRYYSEIEGIKNIRFCNNPKEIMVKTTSLKGEILPYSLNIRGKEYKIFVMRSENFADSLNY